MPKRLLSLLAAIPLALLLPILLTVCDLLAAVMAWTRIPAGKLPAPSDDISALQPTGSQPGVSIVILNWNGRPLLEESLPLLKAELRRTSIAHEVIVVDNGSSDDSVAFVQQHFPHFQVLQLPSNLGFGEGNNAGVRLARHDLVLLLNNDMLVQPNFLEPLVAAMAPRTFAATSQIFLPPGIRREETGKTAARVRHGFLELSHEEITPSDESSQVLNVFWAGGGSSLYRRTLLLALGGFDSLYSPGYAEDADLSFRAWQAGYSSVIATRSQVIHKHRSSTRKRFGDNGAQRLMHRNIRLFFLKNFSLSTLWKYFLWLPANSRAGSELQIILRTLPRWPLLLLRRIGRRNFAHHEREIFARMGTPVPQGEGQTAHLQSGPCLSSTVRGPLTATHCQSPAGKGQRVTNDRHLNFQHSAIRNLQSTQRSLHILYVSAYVPHLWRHGGAGRVFQLIRRVAQRHCVSVATFYENDFERKECDKLRQFCQSVTAVYRRGKPARNIYPYEPFEEFHLPEMRRVLRQVRLQQPFDIVHFEYPQMACYADLFPDAIKFLTEVEVNYAAAASKIAYIYNPLRRLKWYYNSMQVLDRELALCRKVDYLVCVNETDAQFLRGYLPREAIQIVQTGVDVEYFAPADNHEEPYAIGFVAAFRHEPNVDAALFLARRIFPLVKRQVPQARLYLIGASPPENVQRLHNGKDLLVTGFVEDLLRYYHRMSVIVVPLRTGVGIRGKILEAWAAGKPVVGTSLAAAGIEARQGENMYIADSAEEFARWTTRLLQNWPARALMAAHARQTAEQFYDWNQLAERLCAIYEAAVRHTKR
ncbi:MAG: glycosyltransferase [Acidobacteria bacterium]|nr:glycosyltransferase [Acidobacteriota bacterium]